MKRNKIAESAKRANRKKFEDQEIELVEHLSVAKLSDWSVANVWLKRICWGLHLKCCLTKNSLNVGGRLCRCTLGVCLVGGEHTDVLLLTLIGDFGEKLVSDLG